MLRVRCGYVSWPQTLLDEGPVIGQARASRADSIRLLPTLRAGPDQEGDEIGACLPALETDPPGPSPVTLAISNATVRLLSEYTGRGPTKARTYVNDGLISVVLQDTLTKGERRLVRDGQTNLVLATRKAYQNTMKAALIAAVEEHSGREVIAFLSDNHIEPDYAVESFVLAPLAIDGEDAPAELGSRGEGRTGSLRAGGR